MPDTDLAIETLSGDIRDALLTHVRAMEDPWSKLPEAAQQEKIDAIEAMAETLVRRAVGIVAASGFDTMHIRLDDFAVKKGTITGKFTMPAQSRNVLALADHAGHGAVIVLADPHDYMGERGEVRADPDEPELFDGASEPLDFSIREPEDVTGDDDSDDDSDGDSDPSDPGEIPPGLDRRKGKRTEAAATA